MKSIAVFWSLASVCLSASAGAQVAAPRSSRSGTECRAEADLDRDGRVTRLEAHAAALVSFEAFDGDGDGRVTRQEAAVGAASWRAARFTARVAALDRDRDGALSALELKLPPRRFTWIDRDRDRTLSRSELWRAFVQAADGGNDTAALRARFWRRDLDRDGVVTRSEALAAVDRRFARDDRNHDGVLTPGEPWRAAGP